MNLFGRSEFRSWPLLQLRPQTPLPPLTSTFHGFPDLPSRAFSIRGRARFRFAYYLWRPQIVHIIHKPWEYGPGLMGSPKTGGIGPWGWLFSCILTPHCRGLNNLQVHELFALFCFCYKGTRKISNSWLYITWQLLFLSFWKMLFSSSDVKIDIDVVSSLLNPLFKCIIFYSAVPHSRALHGKALVEWTFTIPLETGLHSN